MASVKKPRDAAQRSVRTYREHMAAFSEMRVLDVWYCSIDLQALLEHVEDDEARARGEKRLAKRRAQRVGSTIFPSWCTQMAWPTIRENPPLIYHWRETGHEEHMANVRQAFAGYRESLSEHRRVLLDHFQLLDIAVKVISVGSVGTLCAVILLLASENDPLLSPENRRNPSFGAGTLCRPELARKSWPAGCGRLPVDAISQRPLLGLDTGRKPQSLLRSPTPRHEGQNAGRHLTPSVMRRYAEVVVVGAWRTAHALANPQKITGYLGNGEAFNEAVADFSVALCRPRANAITKCWSKRYAKANWKFRRRRMSRLCEARFVAEAFVQHFGSRVLTPVAAR